MRRFCLIFMFSCSVLHAQGLEEYKPSPSELKKNYLAAQEVPQKWNSLAFQLHLDPVWLSDGKEFWYQSRPSDGSKEFILFDVVKLTKQPAFDHAKLAAAIENAGGGKINPKWLPFDKFEFLEGKKKVVFDYAKYKWTFDTVAASATKVSLEIEKKQTSSFRSTENANSTSFSANDELESVGDAPQVGKKGPKSQPSQIILAKEQNRPKEVVFQAPNKKLSVVLKNNNVFLRAGDAELTLTRDGTETANYGAIAWSNDSRKFVVHKIVHAEKKFAHLIESSPPDGGRAVLRSHPYSLPGDNFDTYETWVFDVEKKSGKKVEIDLLDFRFSWPRWSSDSKTIVVDRSKRGHQLFQIIEIDASSLKTRVLFEDKSATFVNFYTNFIILHLENSNEIIKSSERDGWNHLYLVDTIAGKIKNQITKGEFVVKSVEHIDHGKRSIIFKACGVEKNQDPYFEHYYKINFDGTGMVPLTPGHGNHKVSFSPDHSVFVDTWSRTDLPPVHELRSSLDGKLLATVEKADIAKLKASGWKPPEVFVAKARDGKTDIWGLIYRPSTFDPKKKYPIIEDIYAGPHGSFVQKNFQPANGLQAVAELGFIVVQCDGMGTCNRSKAFHDVCWQNIADAGFPDRIAWIKAIAAKYPQANISKVGIFGTSAGGQNSTGALLFHGDFYKVAVSSCGCHDNRMDKSSWNEQWMGYPVGPHYAAQSNITNAKNLKGKLFLIVGELDENVPPESTLRLADALIKANKDFDLLVIPGAGHTSGGSYGEHRRRDYFVRHLLGVEPPSWDVK